MRDFQQLSRSPAISGEAMAATSHPLATLAAIEVLRAGGNAVDAAVAAAVLLCVAEPQMTGTGGDCFVLYSPKSGLPKALNGSGRAPAKAKAEWFAERGMETIPFNSPHAVTVPGCGRCLAHPAPRLRQQGSRRTVPAGDRARRARRQS